MASGPLSDLRVVEYSMGPSGPMCAKVFADLGADVLKIEPPDGDPARRLGPFPGDVPDPEASGIFLYLNANKRSVTLDLSQQSDRNRLYDLAASADIFVTDVQPSRAAQLGISSETLKRVSPDLIRVYVTPFGNTGPYRDWKGTDLIAWHMGGMGWESPAAFVTAPDSEGPIRGRGNMGMYLAGWVGAAGAMCALFHRDRYGIAQEVDVSAMDAVASHIRGNFATYSYDISRLPEGREKVFFRWVWDAADGYASQTFFLDHWWQKLKEIMCNPEWADDTRFDTLEGRRDNMAEIEKGVAQWTRHMRRVDLYRTLQGNGIPCFPVQTVDEVVASEHYASRGFFVEQDHPIAGTVRQPGPAVRFSKTPWALRSPAPTLGQHNHAVPPEPVEGHSRHAWNLDEQGRSTVIEEGRDEGDGLRNKPLSGIRIIDFGWILSVPYAGGWLGSLGAEVIRVESNTRLEPGRSALGGGADGVAGVNRSAIWNCLNHSKLGVTLNIRDPEGQRLVKELVAVSDVVIENFSTGVLDRQGLGYDDLRKVRPDIIVLGGSTMGTFGPDRDSTGFGPNVCSYAGQPSVTGYEGGQPQNLGGNWPDYLVGTMMVQSVLSALWHRRKTGQGQRIELAMAEVVSSMIPEALLDFVMNARVQERIGNRDPHMAPHNVYRCAGDDQWVAIAVQTDGEWNAFCQLPGSPTTADDPRFATLKARKLNEEALDSLISEWVREQTAGDVTHQLQNAGIAAGPVMDVVALMADEHFRERGNIIEMDHAEVGLREVSGLPIRFSEIPTTAHYSAPQLGRHNDDVFCGLLGHGQVHIESLKVSKAIY